jgi:hypothetical protein
MTKAWGPEGDLESIAPENICAHWLGRATEAMSPLHSRPHTALRDVFRRDEGAVSEGSLVSAERISHPSIDEEDLGDGGQSTRR